MTDWNNMYTYGIDTVRANRTGKNYEYLQFNWKNAEIRYYKSGTGLVRDNGLRGHGRKILDVREQRFEHSNANRSNFWNTVPSTGRLHMYSYRGIMNDFWIARNPRLEWPVIDPSYEAQPVTTHRDSWEEIKRLSRAVILTDPAFATTMTPNEFLRVQTATDERNFKIDGSLAANPRIGYMVSLIMAVNYPLAWGHIFRGRVRLARSGPKIPFQVMLRVSGLRQLPAREVMQAGKVLGEWINSVKFDRATMMPVLRQPVPYE